MKNLSAKIQELNSLIEKHGIRTISFDIDGTLYPMNLVRWRWRKTFFMRPIASIRFLMIRKKWEDRRKGAARNAILPQDVKEFEQFLEGLLDESLVPVEIRHWLHSLNKKNIDLYFLTDHGAEVKLRKLNLVTQGRYIDCLKETGELKPHFRISQILKDKFLIRPETHLHLGDRWTDEAQAKLFGSYFQYLKP